MARTRALRAASAVVVVAVVIFAQIGLVLAPSQLGRNPLLILALRPTPAFLVLVADTVRPVVAILIAVTGRTAIDMAYFATARHGAAPFLQRFGIGRELTEGLSGRRASRGLLITSFFWSSSPVIAGIGLSRTSPWLFLAVTGAGNLTTSTVYVYSGRRFARLLAPVDAWLAVNKLWVTLALAGLVTVSVLMTYRRHRTA